MNVYRPMLYCKYEVHSRAGAYQLLNCDSFPTLHIGKRKIAPKSKVLEWIDQMTSH